MTVEGTVGGTAGVPVGPGEDPWSAGELDELREGLQGELARIGAQMDALTVDIAAVIDDSGDGAGDDQADSGSKAFEREQGMSLLARLDGTRTDLALALSRLDDGTYGVCAGCAGPVGKRRLQAFPRAVLCLACKQRQERR